MNYNQNKKIAQISTQTLIIGVDIAKFKHVAHAQEFRGMEFGSPCFKEIPDASVNIRKKLLFKEVERFNYITWVGNIHYTYPDIDLKYHQTVSPDRQVYFFYSFKETEKEFRGRYSIYDVETKENLAGGGIYIPKYPTYKEHLKN